MGQPRQRLRAAGQVTSFAALAQPASAVGRLALEPLVSPVQTIPGFGEYRQGYDLNIIVYLK